MVFWGLFPVAHNLTRGDSLELRAALGWVPCSSTKWESHGGEVEELGASSVFLGTADPEHAYPLGPPHSSAKPLSGCMIPVRPEAGTRTTKWLVIHSRTFMFIQSVSSSALGEAPSLPEPQFPHQ